MAIRTAIGAGRARIIRQLLIESMLLALAGGASGPVVAVCGIDVLRAIEPKDIPRLAEVGVSAPVLGFTLAISILVGILFGIAPALQASKPASSTVIKDGFMTTQSGFSLLRSHRSRNLLVVSQVGLSLVLLVGAGLIVRSFLRLTSVKLGFNPDRVLTLWVNLSAEKSSAVSHELNFYEQTLDGLKALSGVESAGFSSFLALSGYATTSFRIEGQPAPSQGEELSVGYKAISAD
jgi:predicted lysophospholipase L1 biosynthesis ABC-type transport system permease subunit